jgi:hypothetical protein
MLQSKTLKLDPVNSKATLTSRSAMIINSADGHHSVAISTAGHPISHSLSTAEMLALKQILSMSTNAIECARQLMASPNTCGRLEEVSALIEEAIKP